MTRMTEARYDTLCDQARQAYWQNPTDDTYAWYVARRQQLADALAAPAR
jgi:hypothetical protein